MNVHSNPHPALGSSIIIDNTMYVDITAKTALAFVRTEVEREIC